MYITGIRVALSCLSSRCAQTRPPARLLQASKLSTRWLQAARREAEGRKPKTKVCQWPGCSYATAHAANLSRHLQPPRGGEVIFTHSCIFTIEDHQGNIQGGASMTFAPRARHLLVHTEDVCLPGGRLRLFGDAARATEDAHADALPRR
jgi:hypothetical protein